MRMKLVSYNGRYSLFRRWIEDPVSVYRDKKAFFRFIYLLDDPVFGPLINECMLGALSSSTVAMFADHGIVVHDCFRRVKK